jgi:DNA-binding CsgD family transcriptional regulator
MILELILVTVIYNLGWFISFKLGFGILGSKVNFRKLYPAMLTMSLFSFSRPFLIFPIYLVLMILLVSVLMMIIGKIKFIKCVLSSLTVIFISAIGDIVIMTNPWIMNNKNLSTFLFTSVYGNIILSIFELIFPVLALIALPKFKHSLLPKISTLSDVIKILVYGIIYSAMMIIANSTKNNNNVSSVLIYLLWVITIIGMLIYYKTVKSLKNEKDKIQNDLNKILAENQRLALEKEALISKIQKSKNTRDLREIVDDFVTELLSNFDLQNRIPNITSINANLAKFGLDSTDGLILYHIVLDKEYQQIADEIYLTESAVKNRVSKMLKKFKLKNRKQLGKFTVENGLVEIITE